MVVETESGSKSGALYPYLWVLVQTPAAAAVALQHELGREEWEIANVDPAEKCELVLISAKTVNVISE
jgi:hypothetical protein